MDEAFAQVLAEETSVLASVADGIALDRWRQRLIDRAMSADSAYAKVLRPVGDPDQRSEFLERWQDLIRVAVSRVVKHDPASCAEIDAHRTAISILAAVYGGASMSRLARDPGPLEMSVALAFVSLVPRGERYGEPRPHFRAIGTMGE